jgi:transcriptional regulator with XRE-family HTH domain
VREKSKSKTKPALPALCAAVRKIREAANWSQADMARVTNIASQSLSRFELGKNIPRSMEVLIALKTAALDVGLEEEAQMFQYTLDERFPRIPYTEHGRAPNPEYLTAAPETLTPDEWAHSLLGRIATKYAPEEARALRAAAPTTWAIIADVVREAETEGQMDARFYGELERKISEIAKRRALQDLGKTK